MHHGNADGKHEAEYVAAAHATFFEEREPLDDPCDLCIKQVGQPLDWGAQLGQSRNSAIPLHS